MKPTRDEQPARRITVDIELPPGIRPDRTSRVPQYIVSVGTPPNRIQERWRDPTDAAKYKEAQDERLRRGEPIQCKKEYLAERDRERQKAADGQATSGERQIRAGRMVNRLSSILVGSYKRAKDVHTATNILVRFLKHYQLLNKPAELVGEDAQRLPEWLVDENYGPESQRAVIRLAREIWRRGIIAGYVSSNPFEHMSRSRRDLPTLDRRGRDRTVGRAPAWTGEQLVAIARLLRPTYVPIFWVAACLGLRRSELAGLQLRDWDSDERRLWVRRQRLASPAKGDSTTKTCNTAPLPVPLIIASMLDRYIDETHGPKPTDWKEKGEWQTRYLFLGVQGCQGPTCCPRWWPGKSPRPWLV